MALTFYPYYPNIEAKADGFLILVANRTTSVRGDGQ